MRRVTAVDAFGRCRDELHSGAQSHVVQLSKRERLGGIPAGTDVAVEDDLNIVQFRALCSKLVKCT